MGKVKSDITVSLDGFITGPNDNSESPLGEGGERLHEWVYDLASFRKHHGQSGGRNDLDSEILEEAVSSTGAVVMGHRMFTLGEKPWGDEPPFHNPVFVVTHHAREKLAKEGGTSFTFVTEGIASALEQAKTAAGKKDVSIAGGANVIQQLLAAGLLDEIQIHLVPIFLGHGRRLFEQLGEDQIDLQCIRVIESAQVTHLRYRIKTKRRDSNEIHDSVRTDKNSEAGEMPDEKLLNAMGKYNESWRASRQTVI